MAMEARVPGGEAGARAPPARPLELPVAGLEGLTEAQVAQRIEAGQCNDVPRAPTRTIDQIIRANVFTRFNAILGVLLLVILTIGPFQDALFGIVLVSNTLIGILQEVRAKRALDRLALLNAPQATVVRSGAARPVALNELVLDDVIEVGPGKQIPVDAVVLSGDLEVDESLLTGESEPVAKD